MGAFPPLGHVFIVQNMRSIGFRSGLSVQQTQDIAQKVLDSLGMGGEVRVQVESNPAAAGLNVPAGVVPTGGTSNWQHKRHLDRMRNDLAAIKTVFHSR